MTVKYMNDRLHKLKSICCSVSFECFTDNATRKANGDMRGKLDESEFEFSV